MYSSKDAYIAFAELEGLINVTRRPTIIFYGTSEPIIIYDPRNTDPGTG